METDTSKSHSSGKNDISLQHLQAELTRIDILIRREVRRWQLAGQNINDNFRGLYVSDSEANSLLNKPFGTSWGHTITLEAQELEAFSKTYGKAVQLTQSLVEDGQKEGLVPRLAYLTSNLGLDPFDLDILLICLAPSLDKRYESLYGYLQDDVTRKRPSVNLILALIGKPGLDRFTLWQHFSDEAPLFKYSILERVAEPDKSPLINQTLHIDETIVSWLLGHYRPGPELGPQTDLFWPSENDFDALLMDELQPLLEKRIDKKQTIVFYGVDHSRQATAARNMAIQHNCPLLQVDLNTVAQSDRSPITALKLALRDARLNKALPFITGWDVFIPEDTILPSNITLELCAFPNTAIVAGKIHWQARGLSEDHSLTWQEFGIPSFAQRRTLWKYNLAEAESEDILEFDLIAGQFLLTLEQIKDACLTARDMAAERGTGIMNSDIFSAAREYSNRSLSKLANKIVPRFGWDDIILPADQVQLLQEIVSTVRGRPVVLEDWGVGKKLASSAGVAILFAGQPGTGKTMGAEIIALELGLDLYKIDLSTVVSKYIGETEKNISKIFEEAETSNAILFFDEADALFGKRSEVRDSHDRYANIEISYLLQRMEAYDGVTILATNMRANLDEAFTRRLHFIVEFPFPDKEDRLRIWEALFPPGVPHETDIDLKEFAKRFRLAGGNIRNILVNAAYFAAADGQQVSMAHLQHSLFRELQKIGRLVDKEDIEDQWPQEEFD
jgi:ATP-dependent 26S proteasome regulatory subunit